MGRLQTWGAAARRSRAAQVAAAVLALALVAGSVVLVTRSAPPPNVPPPPLPVTTRAVALGDSVPYGHGLANPYLTPQIGLSPSDISQGPSTRAYPSLVAGHLGLTMTVRATNCHLTGDQLAISGAVANGVDNTSRDGQCPVPPQPARNLADEIAATDLALAPARLILLQDGADDIDFSACLEYQLAQVLHVRFGLGHSCVAHGAVTPRIAADLSNVRRSLARAIEVVAPHASTVAVLDYYQPIPQPSQIVEGAATSGLHTNLVCSGLKPNAGSTYSAAQIVLTALNRAIAGAVADARLHHVRNVTLVDVSKAFDGHGICTADPWAFSGEPVSDTTLAADAEHILAARACSDTTALHGTISCAALTASALRAERNLQAYVWRAAHPTAAGQRAARGAGRAPAPRPRLVDGLAKRPDEGGGRVRASVLEQTTHERGADHHPVRHLADPRRLLRCRDADADTHRHVGATPDPFDDRGHVRAQVDPLPGDAHAGHGVDEAPRPLADARDAVGRGRRRHQEDGVHPRCVSLSGPGGEFLNREIGDDGPAHAGGGHRSGHPLVSGPVDQVVVGHDRDRHGRLRPRDPVEYLIGHGAPAQRPQGGFLDHRSVHHGVREGDADLDRVRPGGDDGGQRLCPVVGHSSHEVGDQEFASLFAPGPELLLELRHRRCS